MNALAQTNEILDRLVAYPTMSLTPNLDLIEYVQDYLRALGVASRLIYDEDGTKANLFATIGPDIEGGIVLSGHTDVVPVDGQSWSSDPFKLAERGGRLFGRGTADMKGFCAAVLAHVPDFLAASPKIPIHIALSYDEEIGCLGVRPMIEQVVRHLPRPRLVIVGEPTSMKVVNAHKGSRRFQVTAWGREAHSSNPEAGLNAILAAGRLLGYLEALRTELEQRRDQSGRFEPPYTTIEVGLIAGGTAANIIPRRCDFTWEVRMLPDQDPDEVMNRFREEALLPLDRKMKERFGDCGVELAEVAYAPPLKADTGSPAEALIYALAQTNESHAVAFTTEAGLFQEADLPTVVCGPGSIDQAHKPDEFIEVGQLESCGRLLERLTRYVSGRDR